MASNPTVSDLRKAAEVTDDEITAAVDAVLAGLATEAYPLAKGWILKFFAGSPAIKPLLHSSGRPTDATNGPRSALRE